MSGNLHRLPVAPEAGHGLVRRRLLREAADLAELSGARLRELQERLQGSGDYAALDFTKLAAVRARAAALAAETEELQRRPFGRRQAGTTREGGR